MLKKKNTKFKIKAFPNFPTKMLVKKIKLYKQTNLDNKPKQTGYNRMV